MATSLNDTTRTTMVGAISTAVSTAGHLLVYTGSAPSKTSAPSGTLLATFAMANPMGSSSSGTLTVTAPSNVTGAASGTPGYYRIIDGSTDNGSHTQVQGSAGVSVSAPASPSAGAPTGSDGVWGGSNASTGTYFYEITATTAQGETTGSSQVTQTVSTATNHIPLSWSAVSGATGYKIYRSGTTGVYGATSLLAIINSGSTTSYNDTGLNTVTGTIPAYNSAGGDLAFASTIASGGTVGITSLSYTDGNP